MGVKEFFPNMYMVLTSMKNLNHAFKPPQATFRVQPRMTRTDVREYLTKIYQLPVVKVNTANHMGRRKRIMGRRRMYSYKRPDFKRAFVTFERTQVYFPSAEAAADN